MQKLFSCHYGSRLYGTFTPESDIDLKHIVLPDFEKLLLGQAPKNVVKKTNTAENKKNGFDDIDEEFIPIHVFARDFLGGQAYALELAHAIEGNQAGQKVYHPLFFKFCEELRTRFLTPNIRALIGYSVNQASLYSFKGERLMAVRDALAVYEMFPPDDKVSSAEHFESRMKALEREYPKCISVTTYDRDGKGAMAPCIKLLERTLPYSATFAYSVGMVKAMLEKYGDRVKAAAADAQAVDWKATMHALRIVDEGVSLLSGKGLSYPFEPDYVTYLLQIKRGERDHAEIIEQINFKLAKLQDLADIATLPKHTQELRQELEDWLLSWLKLFYAEDARILEETV